MVHNNWIYDFDGQTKPARFQEHGLWMLPHAVGPFGQPPKLACCPRPATALAPAQRAQRDAAEVRRGFRESHP